MGSSIQWGSISIRCQLLINILCPTIHAFILTIKTQCMIKSLSNKRRQEQKVRLRLNLKKDTLREAGNLRTQRVTRKGNNQKSNDVIIQKTLRELTSMIENLISNLALKLKLIPGNLVIVEMKKLATMGLNLVKIVQ